MTKTAFNPAAKLLHWLIAGMIVLQFILAKLAENAEDVSQLRQLVLLANHKSLGISILALALVRLAWRLRSTPPAPLPMPAWQRSASQVSHLVLYALLLLLPITGWLMSSASAYSVSWFNVVPLPDFVAPNAELQDVLEEVHETFAKLLLLLALLHIFAALKHSLYDKDGAVGRISSVPSIAAFVAVLVFGGYALTRSTPSSIESPGEAELGLAVQQTQGKEEVRAAATSMLPLWQIDHGASYIRFATEQAGAEFSGEWTMWSAEIRFDAGHIDTSLLDVNVFVAAVETDDDDRNDALQDPDWFDAESFPEAFYRASRFSKTGDGEFLANGSIVIKGIAYPAPLAFSVTEVEGRQVLDGTVRLDRLALGLGSGEWTDTSWVGQMVTVDVRVEATVSD